MSLFTPESKGQILEILSGLVHPVRILFFKQAKDCLICPEQQRLLEELTKLSEKLSLRVYDVVFHGDQAMNYQINRVPATVIMGEEDYGIRFYGLTAGHEFSSLISTIMMISIGAEITPEYEERIGSIEKPVHIKVMTTLTCPYYPTMVNAANLMAFLNLR